MARKALTAIPNLHELLVREVVDYAIYMLSPDGRVISWNTGAERIKGYGEAEILGSHFSRFYTDEERDAGVPAQNLLTAAETGRLAAEGWRVRRDGSHFWAMVVIDAIYQEGEVVGFAKITRDVTERREAQLALEASRQQLFQAQKMEAVGQLTGGLAHDFNNVLTGIIGSLSLIESRLRAGRYDGLERYIVAAQGAAARAAALTHRLLSFARRQTLDARVTEINALIAGMSELVEQTVGGGVTLQTNLEPALWSVRCDANQLENAILNLCLNARDAMPSGGCITIGTANQTLADHAGDGLRLVAGDYVTITVQDTGTGMTPDIIARAFDPFFTTKPIGKGTGLGLSMIHGFAEQSDGRVRILSEPGRGTTVTLFLPRHHSRTAEEKVDEQSDDRSFPSHYGLTVLIVDDEAAIRMLAAEVLSDLGYRCLQAGCGEDALALVRDHAEIALLITDIGLPGTMNGRQLTEAARMILPELKVLFITGYADNAAIGGAFGEGTRVLGKPFSLDVLANQVNELCA